MDNSGRPNETEMIDGEPYSVDELRYAFETDPDFMIWWNDLSPIGQMIANRMLWGQDPRKAD